MVIFGSRPPAGLLTKVFRLDGCSFHNAYKKIGNSEKGDLSIEVANSF